MHECLQRDYLCDNVPGMLDVQGNVKSWHVSDINTEELLWEISFKRMTFSSSIAQVPKFGFRRIYTTYSFCSTVQQYHTAENQNKYLFNEGEQSLFSDL